MMTGLLKFLWPQKVEVSVIKFVLLGLLMTLGACQEDKNSTLKVSFPWSGRVLNCDPARIHLAHEYILLENIYSPLIETDKNGKISGGIAERFYWEGNDFKLVLKKIKTSNGDFINGEDVYVNFVRNLKLQTSTHGSLSSLLCDQKCPNISYTENTVTLHTKKKHLFLSQMLSSIDFAIIPKKSLSENLEKIISYSNTSGPYFVSSSEEGRIVLQANKDHYHYSKEMPQNVVIIALKEDADEIFKMLEEGKIDHIPTVQRVNSQRLFDLFKKAPQNKELHETEKIRSVSLFLTEKGRRSLDSKTMSQIGSIFKKITAQDAQIESNVVRSDQFIYTGGFGSLEGDQLEGIKMDFSRDVDKGDLSQMIDIGVLWYFDFDKLKERLKNIPKISLRKISNVPKFETSNVESYPHFYISGLDASFLEDVSFINYTMSADNFQVDFPEKWKDKYISSESREVREEMLKSLHYETLKSGKIIPLLATSYVALSNGEWSMNLSKVFANNQFWYFRKK